MSQSVFDSMESITQPSVRHLQRGDGAALGDLQQNLKSNEFPAVPCEDDDSPSMNQKFFLVLGVAFATICFCTNILHVWVFARPTAIRSVKNILLLSQALSGLVASFVPIFPIRVISVRADSGYNGCYLGHSGIILVALLTSLSTSTLLILHHYLTNSNPKRYSAAGNSLIGWTCAVGLVWTEAITIALLPWGGWNSWITHDAHCHLSTIWPLSFTAFMTFIVGAHMATTVFMWASSRASNMKAATGQTSSSKSTSNPTTNERDPEATPIAPSVKTLTHEGRVRMIGWLMTVGSLVPLLGHVLVASSCAASSVCVASPHHYHEDAPGALPWPSLMLTVVAIANPLLYIFLDDQVSSMTLVLLSTILCWCRKRKQQEHLVPQQREARNAETNVYVTNDTDYLIGDAT